jgi:hypothetical protein
MEGSQPGFFMEDAQTCFLIGGRPAGHGTENFSTAPGRAGVGI